MRSSKADFYSIPGQKWLCGPEGIGALYVNRERLGDLLQTYVGYPSLRDGGAYDETGIFLPPDGGQALRSRHHLPPCHGRHVERHPVAGVARPGVGLRTHTGDHPVHAGGSLNRPLRSVRSIPLRTRG